jgi:DNA-binding NtrC family response regulator
MTDHATGAIAFLGRSAAACGVRSGIASFAPTDMCVLIVGATGTGKELVARAVHETSARRAPAVVAVDGGAISESLAESELFGHVRGAFTGAIAPRPGLFAEADGGTIFLDEISNASLALQARLLRVLESREMRAVGATRARAINVRVVAATNRDLSDEVRAGRFRDDLLYRLDVLQVRLPTLSERREDIPGLAEHLLECIEARTGMPACLSPEAMLELQARDWPGNVRQLRNALERAAVLARGSRIEVCHLPMTVDVPPTACGSPAVATASNRRWRHWQAEHERAFLLERLEANGWNRSATAREVGLSRQALHEKLRRHELRPRLVSPEPSGGTIVPMARLAAADAR